MAFAHGKVLLFGEHAVVYGCPALAVGLRDAVAAHTTEGPPGVDAPGWGMAATVGDGTRVAAAFRALIDALPSLEPGRVRLEPNIPAGAGVGSSAAMAVAAARALAERQGTQLDDAALFEAAMASERVFHGTPSGLDHTVAIRGGLLRFVRGTPPDVRPCEAPIPLDLIVIQAAPGADTGAMVAGVRALRDHDAALFGGLLSRIEAIVAHAEHALAVGDVGALGALMDENHACLGALGVSSPVLDAACASLRSAGAAGAKLTGAGGGGCVVGVAPPGAGAGVLGRLTPAALWSTHLTIEG